MNSITREQAEERLKSSNVKALRAEVLDMLFPAPSPHPFIPKEGEVIAVRDKSCLNWEFDTFVKMGCGSDFIFCCGSCNWKLARPLTDKERRV